MVPRLKSEVAIAMIDMLFELNKSVEKVGLQYYNRLNSSNLSTITVGFENMLDFLEMKKCFDEFCRMIFAWLRTLQG